MTILKQPFIEKNIKGKPYITVSAKGIANGLSDIPNDGADFGPDTMLNATDPSQIGAPYTKTTGIAEAVYYQANINHKKIFLLPGFFYLYSQIPIYANTHIEGTGHIGGGSSDPVSYLRLSTNLGNNPVMPFMSSSLSNKGIVLRNILFDGEKNTASAIIDFSVFPENSYLNILENIYTENTQNFTYDFNLSYMEDGLFNYIRAGGNIIMQVPRGQVALNNSSVGNLTVNGQNIIVSNTVIWNSIILTGNSPSATLNLNNVWFNSVQQSAFYVATTAGWLISCNGCRFYLNQNQGSPYPVFALQSGTSSGSIIASFRDTSFSYINVSSSGAVPYPMFASGITGKVTLHNVRTWGYSIPSTWTDWQNWLVDYEPKNTNTFSITTPAVPASGTAITNNYPFSVDIYITNAGSVSSYQINNLTISAGLSVGQKITLAPGGTLTLTYTTAPTWTWTFHV
jgi:hypothetical protein